MVKIIATSDLHGRLPQISACDLLLICGDICPDVSSLHQAKWLDEVFRNWLEKLPAKEIVCIAGNHDRIFEQARHLVPKEMKFHYLQDNTIELYGLKIYGTPWQLPFWGVFNLSDDELEEQYSIIPKDIDILMSHAPPYGIFDEVPRGAEQFHTGSIALRKKVFEVNPQLFVCGHIHCSFGMCKINETIFANVSLLDNDMKIAHEPVAIEIQARKNELQLG